MRLKPAIWQEKRRRMKFQKGQRGNSAGAPKGRPHKRAAFIRALIQRQGRRGVDPRLFRREREIGVTRR
jgi:hypothetical protein